MSRIKELLTKKADDIDITIPVYRELNKFINQLEEIYGDDWEIYPQGSVRLGTVIRNLKEDKNKIYDIDLVAYNKNENHSVNKEKEFKYRGKPQVENDIEEKKPCWTIKVGNELSIDITPSVYDRDKKDTSEKITRTDNFSNYEWKDSNPKGYYYWFKEINQEVYNEALISQEAFFLREGLEKKSYKPLIRTNLQRSIQILKYLRDEHFDSSDNKEYKPISIVITTFTTQIFKYLDCNASIEKVINEFIRISNILKKNKKYSLENFSESSRKDSDPINEFHMENGKWYLPNPTDENENFVDRWNEGEEGKKRANAFFDWIKVLEDTLSSEEKLEDILYPPQSLSKETLQTGRNQKPYAKEGIN